MNKYSLCVIYHIILKSITSSTLYKNATRLFKFRDSEPIPESIPIDPVAPKKPKIGLALSSGGARGLAHIGVIEVLEENDISVDVVSGASMGAYIGAHYSCGLGAKEMKEAASQMKDRSRVWKIADPVIPPVKGFFKGEKAVEFLKESIGDPDFSELQVPLYLISFDLDTQEKLIINEGNVAHAVHASCAIPGVIIPVEWNGHRCSDGGVVDPVPVQVLKDQTDVDLVIAVSLLPSLADIEKGRTMADADHDPMSFRKRMIKTFNRGTNLFADGNTVDTLRRSVRAAQAQIAHLSCLDADVTIRPDAYNLPWHSFESFETIIEEGRRATLEQLPKIKKRIEELEGAKGLPTRRVA